MKEKEKSRSVFGSILRLAVLGAIAGFAAKFVAEKKRELSGLTVSEAKSRFEEKLGPRLGEDTASDIANAVVEKLRERGIVVADPEVFADDGEDLPQ